MNDHHGDGHRETQATATETPFDFSPLAHFQPRSVAVGCLPVDGLLCARRGATPLSAPLGESCGAGTCRYRAHDLLLHASRHALVANYLEAARASQLPPDIVAEGLMVDVWSVRSERAVRTADLRTHPILRDVRLTADRLHSRSVASVEWELVRILRDVRDARVIRLASDGFVGKQLIVHDDLARQLRVTHLGTLQETFPILAADLGHGSAAAALLRRLRRRR